MIPDQTMPTETDLKRITGYLNDLGELKDFIIKNQIKLCGNLCGKE